MSKYTEALTEAFALEPLDFMTWVVQQDNSTLEYTTMAICAYLTINTDDMPGPGATT